MDKRKVIGTIIGLVLAVLTYFLLTNSHADFFSASSELDLITRPDYCQDPGSAKDMISLMYLDDSYDWCYNYSLDAVGWITAVVIIGIVPLLLGMLIAKLVVKKK